MEYRGYKIEHGVSKNHLGEDDEYWYCKLTDTRGVTTGSFDRLKEHIDDQVDNAIHYAEIEELHHEAMLLWYE